MAGGREGQEQGILSHRPGLGFQGMAEVRPGWQGSLHHKNDYDTATLLLPPSSWFNCKAREGAKRTLPAFLCSCQVNPLLVCRRGMPVTQGGSSRFGGHKYQANAFCGPLLPHDPGNISPIVAVFLVGPIASSQPLIEKMESPQLFHCPNWAPPTLS